MEERGEVQSVSRTVYVTLRSLYPANMTVAGVSGRKYHFPECGAEVKVLETDAEKLLAARRGGCCGGTPKPLFELVK